MRYDVFDNENFVMSSHMSFCLTRFEGQNNTFDLYITTLTKWQKKCCEDFRSLKYAPSKLTSQIIIYIYKQEMENQ